MKLNRSAEVQQAFDSIGDSRAEGARNWTMFYLLAVISDSQFDGLMNELKRKYLRQLSGRPSISQRVPDHRIGVDTMGIAN